MPQRVQKAAIRCITLVPHARQRVSMEAPHAGQYSSSACPIVGHFEQRTRPVASSGRGSVGLAMTLMNDLEVFLKIATVVSAPPAPASLPDRAETRPVCDGEVNVGRSRKGWPMVKVYPREGIFSP